MSEPAAPGGRVERAGPFYATFLATRIADEEKRVASLQTRGLAVVTTSGTLVTLLIAIAKFGVGKDAAQVPALSRWLVGVATVLFVLAAFGGLAANLPRKLGRPRIEDLVKRMEGSWNDPGSGAEKAVAVARATALGEQEQANDSAARAVVAALAAEVLAIGLAAIAVCVILVN